jgi:hypothetical protein
MTSVLRYFSVKKDGLTLFLKPESPCYDPGTGNNVLFPFSYLNGILDISYSGNNFKESMVDVTGQKPLDETDTSIRMMGGIFLVTSLGENFKSYIRSWRSATIDPDSPITIYTFPQIIRVQQASLANIDSDSQESFSISNQPPASDTYPTGSVANDYDTTFIFKTPLTFTIYESGVIKYITFVTILDQE